MKEFLEKTLQQKISIREYNDGLSNLPLSFRGKYFVYSAEIFDFNWIAIKPRVKINLTTLRHDRELVEKTMGMHCALFLDSTTFYIKEKLIEEGIPFVIKDKQVYLPFLGFLLSNDKRKIKPVHLISYLTPKMLITAIYERWEMVNVTQAAAKLSVSKVAISRCFDEISYLEINALDQKGKSRVITIPKDVKVFWNEIKGFLRNPIIKKYELLENIHISTLAGLSALSELTMIEDNNYPTYGVTKKDISNYNLRHMEEVFYNDVPGCVVLELGYYINYDNRNIQDPISIYLSLTEEEKQDERIMGQIELMFEEHIW